MTTYVLAVIAITLLAFVTTAGLEPVTRWDWAWFGLLAGAAMIHLEASRGIERLRELGEGTPYTHMQSTWFFAAVLMLPLPLQTALIVISFTHEWFRVFHCRAIAHRKVFSASTVVLAVAAATLVLHAFYPDVDGPFVAALTGPYGTVAVLAAGLVYRAVNYLLVIGAIIATHPDQPARISLGPPSDQLIIAAAIGLGYGIAVFAVDRPWSMPILLITVLALHLGLLLPQLREASRTDAKTGLVDAAWWTGTAERELERAGRLDSPVGVLMLDLDHFKHINDQYGHLAGDAVLRAVADTLHHSVRSYDLVGRWGGEEFVILLPGIDAPEIADTAERVRAAVSVLRVATTDRTGTRVTITGLTASLGAGTYPATATELSPLLLAVDDALYRAKHGGRDQVQQAGTVPPARTPTD